MDGLFTPWVAWLMVGVIALIVEFLTVSMVSIWFVPSAVIVALLSLVCPYIWVQLIVFFVLSGGFLWLFKKKFAAKLSRKDNDKNLNPDSKLVGKVATAQTEITDTDGKVLVGDIYWRAVCDQGNHIEEGREVIINAVCGTTLLVSEK